ncbi:MFS transporter [bacterium]|nr:MFS transporter [bacterium]
MKKGHFFQIILIVIATLLYFVANIQRVAVPGAIFDTLQKDLMTNPSAITALGASFMYIYAISQLIVGLLNSRYGGYRIITIGAIIFSIGGLIFPLTHNLWFLYLSRCLVGLGSATFYLGIIQETKNVVSHNNFGIALSVILFIGYFGGIVANAPLVMGVNEIGWRNTFLIIGGFAAILTVLFLFFKFFIPKQETKKEIKFNLEIYKEVLKNRANIILYGFGCLNYGIYYLLQTVIGKKFLEDFCEITVLHAAVVLSVMGALYAISGPILAYFSKILLNRRTIFLKIAALNTFATLIFIIICLAFDFRTPIIAVMFCVISFFACLSPLLIPLIHDINGAKNSGVATCIMTACFYFVVAILGNITGQVLNFFEPLKKGESLIYSNKAYMIIFAVMLSLSVISTVCVFFMKESKKTMRFLKMCKYMETKYGTHWHDKYEHDLYSGI